MSSVPFKKLENKPDDLELDVIGEDKEFEELSSSNDDIDETSVYSELYDSSNENNENNINNNLDSNNENELESLEWEEEGMSKEKKLKSCLSPKSKRKKSKLKRSISWADVQGLPLVEIETVENFDRTPIFYSTPRKNRRRKIRREKRKIKKKREKIIVYTVCSLTLYCLCTLVVILTSLILYLERF
eukprot:TRINITY_DN1491_c0_g1_i1.p1 TRINITY_DN1491_c0_g1~~TRINITY_DN1491_c0_g1_i1.p1  ORF type:complete len:187 (+),score=17.69 TRINITY_DN1491_c0_g1_i1:21-581(+)